MGFYVPLDRLPRADSRVDAELVPRIALRDAHVYVNRERIAELRQGRLFVDLRIMVFRRGFHSCWLLARGLRGIRRIFQVLVASIVGYVQQGQRAVLTILLVQDLLRRTSGAFRSIIRVDGITLTITMIRSLSNLTLRRLINRTRMDRVQASDETVCYRRTRAHK